MPDPETVLSEMSELGLVGTELGAPGFLPHDPNALASLLARHQLALVGAFVPLVLHEPGLEPALGPAREAISLLQAAGGQVLVVAAVRDMAWSEPGDLDDGQWRRLADHAAAIESLAADHGLTFALHPHAGTLVETAAQVQRALEVTGVGWCLDTGHLAIGGTDPGAFAADHGHRVTHVHLKDIDAGVAAELRAGGLSLLAATRAGLFVPLGRGAAPVARVLDALDDHGYDGWIVLEQDTTLTADEPRGEPAQAMLDAMTSIAFLNSAHTTEEINR